MDAGRTGSLLLATGTTLVMSSRAARRHRGGDRRVHQPTRRARGGLRPHHLESARRGSAGRHPPPRPCVLARAQRPAIRGEPPIRTFQCDTQPRGPLGSLPLSITPSSFNATRRLGLGQRRVVAHCRWLVSAGASPRRCSCGKARARSSSTPGDRRKVGMARAPPPRVVAALVADCFHACQARVGQPALLYEWERRAGRAHPVVGS